MSPSPTRDYLRLYRVRDWLHFLPLPLAGWFASPTRDVRALVGGVLGWGFALAYTSSINQAFDDRLDRLHVGKNPVGRHFSRRQALLLSLPPALATLAVIAWLSPAGLLPALALLAAATLYSAPPRLKRVPVLGTLWNIAVGIPGLLFAGQPALSAQPLRLTLGLFALLLIVSQLIHEAEDQEDDRQGGIVTTAILTGTTGALLAASVLLFTLPGATWWLSHGLQGRMSLTVAATTFSVIWLGTLLARVRRSDHAQLRQIRLRYRYSAFVFGALVFLASLRPL